MNWDGWMATWRLHAATGFFRHRLKRAVEIAEEGARGRKLFCALSGGKDGVALAGVLVSAGLREIQCVHCHTPLNTPGMEETAIACAERLELELEIIEPDRDAFEILDSLPKDISIFDERNNLELRKAIASGNMLVAYQYERGFAGAFSGMRAEESHGRAMNRALRGHTYQLKIDGSWMCCPIADWSARDVFAWLVHRDLPIHPHYRLLLERFGVSPESPGSRVDCVITTDGISGRGATAHLRSLYPALWRKITDIRPELGRET